MYCGPIKKLESSDSFYYSLGDDFPSLSPRPFLERFNISLSYKLIKTAQEWFSKEKEALSLRLSGEGVIQAQISFAVTFCQVKALPVSADDCAQCLREANTSDQYSIILESIFKIRRTLGDFLRIDPYCYQKKEFKEICQKEAHFLHGYLSTKISQVFSLPSIKLEFLPLKPKEEVYEGYVVPLKVFQEWLPKPLPLQSVLVPG